jgi:hypothetical protein
MKKIPRARPERRKQLQQHAANAPGPGGSFPVTDSGRTGTPSSTIRMHRASPHGMKPRIHCVLAQ